jgi:hypothetical protein
MQPSRLTASSCQDITRENYPKWYRLGSSPRKCKIRQDLKSSADLSGQCMFPTEMIWNSPSTGKAQADFRDAELLRRGGCGLTCRSSVRQTTSEIHLSQLKPRQDKKYTQWEDLSASLESLEALKAGP